jgi:hypothetical protein
MALGAAQTLAYVPAGWRRRDSLGRTAVDSHHPTLCRSPGALATAIQPDRDLRLEYVKWCYVILPASSDGQLSPSTQHRKPDPLGFHRVTQLELP